MVMVVFQADAKEIGDNGVDGGRFPEVPSNSGSVIASLGGGLSGRISSDMREYRLLQD